MRIGAERMTTVGHGRQLRQGSGPARLPVMLVSFALLVLLGASGLFDAAANAAICEANPLTRPKSRQKSELAREAVALARERRYGEARAIYLIGLSRFPGDALLLRGVAQVDSWEGCWPLAEAEYRKVLSDDASDDEARGGLIDLLSWQSRWREAERLVAEGLAKDPASTPLLVRAARLASWRGDATEARQLANRALQVDPKDDEVRALRDGIILGETAADLRIDAYPGGYPSVYTYGASILQRYRKLELGFDSHIVERAGGTLTSPIVDALRTLSASYHPTYGMLFHIDASYGTPAIAIPHFAIHASFSSSVVGRLTGTFDATYWSFTESRTVYIFNPSLGYEIGDQLEIALRWYTAYLSVAAGEGHSFDSDLANAIDAHARWRASPKLALSADYTYGAQLEASPTLEQIFSYRSHVVALGADLLVRPDAGVRGLLGFERRASDATTEVVWIETVQVGGYVRW